MLIKSRIRKKMKKNHLVNLFKISLLSVSVLSVSALAQVPNYSTDVIGISEKQLLSEHWLNKLSQNSKTILNQKSIAQLNQNLVENNPYITDPLSLPEQLTKDQILAKINSISKPSSHARFYDNGKQVTKADYANYIESTNQNAINDINNVRYGVVVTRSVLRTFPTLDRIFKPGKDRDLDRFQESGLFPGDAVAILHTSKNGQWYLVQAYNYLAWMPKVDVAIGDKNDIAAFKKSKSFVVVTGNKIFTNYVPNHPELSNVQLDMGTRLPLAKRSEYSNEVYGQNPFANYIVKFPSKDDSGKLIFKLTPIPRGQDVRVGYLPFTQQNLVKQAFKFLGERYGWGHDYNGRDCTGFVGEIYKSFGFQMPRNSGQQAKSTYGINNFFDKASTKAEKFKVIKNMQVGDLIYIPGHVMMYLGEENGKPYVIHDVKGLSYLDEKGQVYRGTLNGVSVTPLLPLKGYVNSITNIKSIRAK